MVPVESSVLRHDIPTASRSGFVLVQDRQVHYLEWGRAGVAPVGCLHGGGQTTYIWEELDAALGPTHHVLAPDLSMHGDSDPVGEKLADGGAWCQLVGHLAPGDNPESTVGLVTSFLADIAW